jgi:dTDP-4-amino-4,6-dideoxygalactose transaminase
VDPKGWQMDLDLLETYLKENTLLKEIEGISYSFHNQQTHQNNYACSCFENIGDMNRLQEIATAFHLVEDSTETLGPLFQNLMLEFWKVRCFQLQCSNKIISTISGGVIVTDDMKN